METNYFYSGNMNHSWRLLGTVVVLFLLGLSSGFSQSFEGGWRVTGSVALQEQDRRLFGLTDRILGREILLHEEQNYCYDLGLTLHKSILHRHDFRLDLGLGYRHEFNTFDRTYDRGYYGKSAGGYVNLILVQVKRYQVHQLVIPLTVQYRLFGFGNSGFVFLGGSIEGSLHVAKTVRNTGAHFGKFDIAPYSLEVNPGIGVKLGGWSGMISYRAYSQRQIDPVIFSPDLFPPWLYDEVPTGYETYNPFKMWITVSRDLEEGWWKGKKVRGEYGE